MCGEGRCPLVVKCEIEPLRPLIRNLVAVQNLELEVIFQIPYLKEFGRYVRGISRTHFSCDQLGHMGFPCMPRVSVTPRLN